MKKRKYFIFWFISIPLFLFAGDFPQIKTSFFSLPFSNGRGAGVYQAGKNNSKLLYFYDHLYKAYDARTTTKTYIRKGIFWGVNDKWLPKLKMKSAGYVPGTGIVQVNKSNGDLDFTEYYFMPYSTDKRIILCILQISNQGAAQDVDVFLYEDNAMGGGGSTRQEEAVKTGDILIESKKSGKTGKALLTGIPGLYRWDYVPDKEQTEGMNKVPQKLKNRVTSQGDNLTGVMQYKRVKLQKGQKQTWLAVLGLSDSEDQAEYVSVLQKLNGMDPELLLNQEISSWAKWQSLSKLPPSMSQDQIRLFQQSTAVLRMGQVQEKGSAFGQILASMPPGQWNIAWVRDGAYSLVSLILSGHLEEARWGLEFMLNAPDGKFNGPEYVGMPYKISVCRYWGNGEEESDYNTSGPNIEWDNFGLFLWAFSEYVKASQDKVFLEKYYPVVRKKIADVLIHLMNSEGYLVPDSSIWERHWEPQGKPDGKKSFTYSTINAIHGLRQLAEISPIEKEKKELLAAAEKMHQGFLKNMIDKNKVVVSCIEEKKRGVEYYMDGSVVEAINFGLVDQKTATATLQAFDQYLKMKNSPGLLRNDDAKDYDNSWYDEQEWVVIDLRVALAHYHWGNKQRSEQLNTWILENARQNYFLIPELLEQNNLSYQGAVPMMGFGPGAFIINMYKMQ